MAATSRCRPAMGATYPVLRTLPVLRGAGGSRMFGAAFYLLF